MNAPKLFTFAMTVLAVALAGCAPAASNEDSSGSSSGSGGSSIGSGGSGSGSSSSGSGGTSAANNGGSSGSGGSTAAGSAAANGGSSAAGSAAGGGGGPVAGSSANGGRSGGAGTAGGSSGSGTFKLTSMLLPDGAMFPKDSTCETSKTASQIPDLTWTGVPPGTMSFAMVFIDTTLVPMPQGYHSALWDVPGTVTMLPAGLPAGSPPMNATGLETVKQKNPNKPAWLGPCPNFGGTPGMGTKTDSYAFRLYALSQASLGLAANTTMSVQQIQTTIEGLKPPPLGVAILTGKSNAAGSSLK